MLCVAAVSCPVLSVVLSVVLGIAETAAATSSRMDILSDDAAPSAADSVDVGTMRPIARLAAGCEQADPPRQSAVVGAALGADRDPGAPDLLGDAPAAAARGRRISGRGGECAYAAQTGRGTAAAAAGRGRGRRGRRHRDLPEPQRSEGRAPAPGRIAQRLVADRGSAARGDAQAGWSQRGPGAAAARYCGLPQTPPPTATDSASVEGKLVRPTTSGTSFAPFMPRSTPKGGESDGL